MNGLHTEWGGSFAITPDLLPKIALGEYRLHLPGKGEHGIQIVNIPMSAGPAGVRARADFLGMDNPPIGL
jgi:hypothetical protein